jgi:hypothetical protein
MFCGERGKAVKRRAGALGDGGAFFLTGLLNAMPESGGSG